MNQPHNFAAQFGGKINRFQCVPSMAILRKTIQTVFSLEENSFSFRFVDDENDLVNIDSQQELDAAVSRSEEVQLVLSKLELQPAKKERLEDEAVIPTAQNKLEKIQSRLQFVQNALAQPNLPEQKRQKLLQRKQKLETLVENHQSFSNRRARDKNPRTRGNDKLKEIDEALAKPNLSVKQIEKLNRKRARAEAAKNNRTQQFQLMELQAALDQKNLSANRAENLARRKAKLEQRISQKNTRLNRQDATRAKRLEAIRTNLAQPNLPVNKKQKLLEKEAKIQAHFQKQDADFENALDGLTL
jgi:hypothetical protein